MGARRPRAVVLDTGALIAFVLFPMPFCGPATRLARKVPAQGQD
jgi:hypothetical protein